MYGGADPEVLLFSANDRMSGLKTYIIDGNFCPMKQAIKIFKGYLAIFQKNGLLHCSSKKSLHLQAFNFDWQNRSKISWDALQFQFPILLSSD